MLKPNVNIRQTKYIRNLQTHKVQVTVAQNAHGHKQRTLEPPALTWRTLTCYVPLRAEGSESVPAVVSAFCGNVTCDNTPRRDPTRKEVYTWTAKQ